MQKWDQARNGDLLTAVNGGRAREDLLVIVASAGHDPVKIVISVRCEGLLNEHLVVSWQHDEPLSSSQEYRSSTCQPDSIR